MRQLFFRRQEISGVFSPFEILGSFGNPLKFRGLLVDPEREKNDIVETEHKQKIIFTLLYLLFCCLGATTEFVLVDGTGSSTRLFRFSGGIETDSKSKKNNCFMR